MSAPTCHVCKTVPVHSVGIPLFVSWDADGVPSVGIDIGEIADDFFLNCDCKQDFDAEVFGPTLTESEIDWFKSALQDIAEQNADVRVAFPNDSDKVGA